MRDQRKAPLLVGSLLALICLPPPFVSALPIDGIVLGATEKGALIGVHSNISKSDQLLLGIQYLQGQVLSVDAGLSRSLPVNVFSGGARLAYNRFVIGSSAGNGLFLQGGLNLQRISAEIPVDLDSLAYDFSGITIACSGCGSVTLRTRHPAVDVVPSFGVGWQQIISNRVAIRAVIGVQYYNPPGVDWQSSKVLPRYARQEINSAVKDLNRQIDNAGNFYPGVGLSATYLF